MWREIYRPKARSNGNFICLCAGVDSYIFPMSVYMPYCVSMHLYEGFVMCLCLQTSRHQCVYTQFLFFSSFH